jgi:hypothetical protein
MSLTFRRLVCAFLSAAFLLQGCQTVGLKYHENGGRSAALKVYPYWEGSDGEKYIVGGLKVTLYPRYRTADDRYIAGKILEETTNPETHLIFDGLEPGSYRLRVFLNERNHISEKLELLPGKRLTVRIDVAGVEKREAFMETLGDIGETLGDAVVMVGAVAILIGVEALKISLSDEEEEEEED